MAVAATAAGGGSSIGLPYTVYIGITTNAMVYNPVNGLFYLSVPSSAGAPYGNSVVPLDPETGAFGTPILVGSEPDALAVTDDGKYLWVGLDGASAVRKVDLSTGIAGLQFSLSIGQVSTLPILPVPFALAALPGATDSVVVSGVVNGPTSQIGSLAIYDSGVVRGTSLAGANVPVLAALQASAATSEVYGIGFNYSVYSFGASGLAAKSVAGPSFADYTPYLPDLQVAGGRVYNDHGAVYNAETGALAGTLYPIGNYITPGPTVADTGLGKVFMLDNPSSGASALTQIQVFDISTLQASASALPVNGAFSTRLSNGNRYAPTSLARWGSNGLAFRTNYGIFSLRSNLVQDLSAVQADLGVTVTASGGTITGTSTTYTANVSNAGPSAATNIALTAVLPNSSAAIIRPSLGTCSQSGSNAVCDLGGLPNGGKASVTFTVQQITPGAATLTAQVSGSENDSASGNNQGSASVSVTGSAYNPLPTLSAISPSSILAGSPDQTVTVTGTNFVSGSVVMLGGNALNTTFVNSTTLKALLPAVDFASLGWGAITVSVPAPGGGTSNMLPFTAYSTIGIGLSHILYDPYSRKLIASVGSGSTTVAANSLVAITPETQALGTPVPLGGQPTALSLTSDGQILYEVSYAGSSLTRFNMLTQQVESTYQFTNPDTSKILTPKEVSAQPGTENTAIVNFVEVANGLYDFNPTAKTATLRGSFTGSSFTIGRFESPVCTQFVNATSVAAFNVSSTNNDLLETYTVYPSGPGPGANADTVNYFGCFKAEGGLVYSTGGLVADPSLGTARAKGLFNVPSAAVGSNQRDVAPDASLQRVFFDVNTSSSTATTFNAVAGYDMQTYLGTNTIPLDVATVEGKTTSNAVDLIRWGQDGLAILSSGGYLYLMRGGAVAPQLLNTNTAAVLTASSATAIGHGAGNTLLTLTGSNFVPGVAVTWNGSYRTTTIVDATHVTVAIPAGDLASTGAGTLVATNPGAPASGNLTITVN